MSRSDRLRRKHKKAPSDRQRGFGFAAKCVGKRVVGEGELYSPPVPDFEAPNPLTMMVNGQRLTGYLESAGQGWIVELLRLLLWSDWSLLESAYKPTGRPPIHPRVILGLVVYGLLLGRTSLRELEMLAQIDLGAWLVCGGLQPDHSTIGKFLNRHAKVLTEDFFEKITSALAQRLQLKPGLGAFDGTVIAAASSRLSTLKIEAAREAAKATAAVAKALAEAEAARQQVSGAPVTSETASASNSGIETAKIGESVANGAKPEPKTAKCLAPAEPVAVSSPEVEAAKEIAATAAEVVRVAEARAAKAEHPGRMAVVPGELDAVIQPLKNGANRPSYKPSIVVHESGLILGKQVDPSSETAVVPELCAQHRRIFGADPTTSLFDAGYCCHEILRAYVDAEEDILCPAGTLGDNLQKRGRKGLYAKADFTYDESADLYRCPQGKALAPHGRNVDREGRVYMTYKANSADCADCPVKELCTKAKARTVSRYEGDELKEAMAQVMAQPSARATLKKRITMVEPAFAFIKEHQGLRRFRRRGLMKVRLEFSLHCLAFNIGRALSLQRRRVAVFLLLARIQGGAWHVIAIAAAAAAA